MKNSVKIVRHLQVESSIVSWMFIGYFVLLAASATLLMQQGNGQDGNTASNGAGGSATHVQMAK